MEVKDPKCLENNLKTLEKLENQVVAKRYVNSFGYIFVQKAL